MTRTAIVTGGSGGIGRCTAAALARRAAAYTSSRATSAPSRA